MQQSTSNPGFMSTRVSRWDLSSFSSAIMYHRAETNKTCFSLQRRRMVLSGSRYGCLLLAIGNLTDSLLDTLDYDLSDARHRNRCRSRYRYYSSRRYLLSRKQRSTLRQHLPPNHHVDLPRHFGPLDSTDVLPSQEGPRPP